MLARRFAIVCLFTMLFGMAFAILVAETNRSPRSRIIGLVVPCSPEDTIACQPTLRVSVWRIG